MRLEFRDVTLRYPEATALSGVDATLEGRVIGLLGANGSGKTSLIKILAGLQEPSSGIVLIDGEEVRPGRIPWISYLPQESEFFPFLQRPSQTLGLSLAFRGVSDPAAPHHLLAALGLEEDDRSAEGYSGGMKQRLRIAQALVHRPRLLLLDEPTTGLDVRERLRVLRLIERLRDLVTVLFSTHHAGDAAAVCDQVLVLHRGAALGAGSPAALSARAQGRVFEVIVSGDAIPGGGGFDVVGAERHHTGRLVVRIVGTPPAGARMVEPRLEDAFLLMTMGPRHA